MLKYCGIPVMTDEEFVDILREVVKEEGANILYIPGVYEVVSEFYTNEVLKIWADKYGDTPE